jgi:hypothetical protein
MLIKLPNDHKDTSVWSKLQLSTFNLELLLTRKDDLYAPPLFIPLSFAAFFTFLKVQSKKEIFFALSITIKPAAVVFTVGAE